MLFTRFSDPLRKNDALFMYGALREKPFVAVYQQKRVEVVCGPSCKPEAEIDIDQCAADGVPIVKRRGGGGTVLLSPGMVITVVVGGRVKGETVPQVFSKIHDAMIVCIDPRGALCLQKDGISDLAVKGKKILGSSLYVQHSPYFYYYQSSLMVASDVALLQRYLRHPLKEPVYRRGRPHHEFCTTLLREGCPLAPETIIDLFAEKLPRYLSC